MTGEAANLFNIKPLARIVGRYKFQGWIEEFFEGGGGSGPEFFEGGFRVQVRGNFHILTSKKKKKNLWGGGGGNPPPLGSATVNYPFLSCISSALRFMSCVLEKCMGFLFYILTSIWKFAANISLSNILRVAMLDKFNLKLGFRRQYFPVN